MTSDDCELATCIDRVTRSLEIAGFGSAVSPAISARARTRALELLGGRTSGAGAVATATLAFTADVLCELAVDLASRPHDARRLVDRIEHDAGVPRGALGRELLRTPSLPQLSTAVAIEVQLALLRTFAEVEAISLWTQPHGGRLVPISHTGDFDPDASGGRLIASELLTGSESMVRRDSEVGIRLDRWLHAAVALVASGEPPRADLRGLLLEAAVPVLGSILERAELRDRDQPSGEPLGSSVERRLARMRFDLHDGPQQEVHLLARDLRWFGDQLRPMIAGDPNADRMLGRVDDFEAQLVALDGDLRRISTSVQSPLVHPGPLEQKLSEITGAFTARSGFEPQTRLDGDLTKLSESAQIALLSLIREALNNVREHSEAAHVTITISADTNGLEVQVCDDGRGFVPGDTMVRAEHEGHLGLVGMRERVRMLGGRTSVESRPGGPTIISASLPAWPPRHQ